MKNVLVLIMVLGIASVANASLMLTVNSAPGQGGDAGEEITLEVCETIWIGVEDIGIANPGHFDCYVNILEDGGVDETQGEWVGGNNFYSPPGLASGSNTYMGYIATYGDIWKVVNSEASTTVSGPGLTADFEFHCTGEGDVVVDIWDMQLGVIDTLTIHQIPEPATIALLGLGGLLLRRRKK